MPAAFAYPLPPGPSDEQVAPLLCAGIIGYRALRRARVPAGGRLGIYGFGSSAHITAQIAQAQGAEVYVMTRGERNRRLAGELGAAFVGNAGAVPPVPLDSAIIFAPAGNLVAGIHLSDVPPLHYEQHLFYERDLRSVTSNTRQDGAELMALAARLPLRVHTRPYGFTDVARALADLASGAVSGSVVILL